jgi:hypothetical protein
LGFEVPIEIVDRLLIAAKIMEGEGAREIGLGQVGVEPDRFRQIGEGRLG